MLIEPSGTILLIEDNDDDVLLICRGFKRSGISTPLQVLSDGEQAIAYLSGGGIYADRRHFPLPALILLDLRLPKKSGMEVLEWIKRSPGLRRLPVVVLTSSREHSDVHRAYDLGANSYLLKPVEFDHLRALLERLHLYWLRTNASPDTATA